MPRWRVDYLRDPDERIPTHLGTVDAPDERAAIEKAAEQFNIPLARQNKIVVTKLNDKR